MSSIDSLNFEVILNDSDFRKTIEADKKLAQSLNTDLTKLLSIRPRTIISAAGVKNAQEMVGYLDQIRTKIASMPKGSFLVGDADALNKTLLQVNDRLDKLINKTGSAKAGFAGMNTQLTATSSLMRTISQLTGASFSVVGLRRFLASLVDITGQFEVQRMALRNMLQDVDGADKIFEDLYRFSSDSTYRFSELAKYAKQLAAFNIDKSGLLETTKMLGDVASGVGVSMDRVILAYGHVKSSGFLRGIQLRSFSQNGIPVLEELSKLLTEVKGKFVSLGDVFDLMMKREIPFEMVEQAFKNMTSEGGKFYQMQEVLAKTLAGQINILKGRWENMLAAVGQANSGILKDSVKAVSDLISDYHNVGKVLKELIVIYGAYKTAVFAATLASEGLFAATFNLQSAFEKLALKVSANPYAAIGLSVTALMTTLYKLGTSVNEFYTNADKIRDALKKGHEEYDSQMRLESAEMERLYERLRLAKKGTEEYAAAKRAIETRFSPYLEQLRAENKEVNDLAKVYGDLAKKIEEANKQRFLESVTETATARFKDATAAIEKDFQYTMKLIGKGLSSAEQYDLWNYIMGGNLYSGDVNRYNKLSALVEKGEYKGEYSGPSYEHWFSVEELRQQYRYVLNAFNETMDDADELFKKRLDENGDKAAGSIDEKVYRISSIVDGIKRIDAEIKTLRDKASGGSITAKEKEALAALVSDRKEQTDLYKEIMGVDYDKDTKNGETAAEKARKNAISDLKTQIALLEKYLSIYQKIEPIKGDMTAKWMSDTMGGKPEGYKDLEGQIEALCASLRKLGDEGVEAADAIEARLGLDAASQLVKKFNADKKAAEDAEKALNKYLEALEQYTRKDSELEGTGSSFKVSKAISTYREAIKKNDDDFYKAAKAAEGAGLSKTQLFDAYGKLDSQWAKNRVNALAKLRADIVSYADSILKEQMQGYDLTDWNDKTLAQIEAIKKALESVEVPDDIKKMLEDYPELLKELEEVLQRQAGTTVNNTVDPAKWEKVKKHAKQIASSFLSVADSLKEYAKVTDNAELSQAAEAVGAIAENMQAAEQGAEAWGGWWGAIIGGVTNIFKQVTEAITETEREATELRDLLRETMRDSKITNFKIEIENAGKSIFGDNTLAEIEKAARGIGELKDQIAGLHGMWAGNNNWLSLFTTSGKYAVQFTKEAENFWHLAERWDIEKIAKETGYKLLDDYGNFNVELLELIKKSGWDLTKEEKDWLENAITISTNYAEAFKTVEDAMTNLFGSVAGDAADAIVDSWVEAGNAALDYADILDDVARAYAKMMIESTIISKFFNPIKDNVIEAFGRGDTDAAMELIAGAMQQIADSAPLMEDILRAFDPYFKTAGSESENSLGQGIKSITEETASLLASYVNALRADLSFIRTLQEKGWDDVAILGAYIPTLNDYLQQIAANTYDTAQSTARILGELQSVIGSRGSDGMVVRVEMA